MAYLLRGASFSLCGVDSMAGERRLTSIKQLVNDMLFNTSTTITNNPLATKEQLTPITLTSTLVSVSNIDTFVLAANPNRKYLLIQRGTTVGRVFVHFGNTTATVTNGMLFRENTYFEMPSLPSQDIYTGEIRAITVGSNKILYISEGF